MGASLTVFTPAKNTTNTTSAAWSWSEHAASEAYQGARQIIPVAEKYRDDALAVVGTVAAAVVAATFCSRQ